MDSNPHSTAFCLVWLAFGFGASSFWLVGFVLWFPSSLPVDPIRAQSLDRRCVVGRLIRVSAGSHR